MVLDVTSADGAVCLLAKRLRWQSSNHSSDSGVTAMQRRTVMLKGIREIQAHAPMSDYDDNDRPATECR